MAHVRISPTAILRRFLPIERSSRYVLTTRDLSVGYENNTLVRAVQFEVQRGERWAILGANGSGKTTLLRSIVSQLRPMAGAVRLGHNVQIGYYAQTHEGLRVRSTLVDEIRQLSHLSEEGARSYLGRFLFTGDHLDWDRDARQLSASEDYCWYSWPQQAESMGRLAGYRFEWVLPGHGQRVHLPAAEMRQQVERLAESMREG